MRGRRKRSIILIWITLLSVMLFACGDKLEEMSVTIQEEQKYYYAMEETTLPDSRRAVTLQEGGQITTQAPYLMGERVFRVIVTTDRDYYTNACFYIQIWEPESGEWKNILVPGDPFTVDGKDLEGLNSSIYSSTTGEMYITAYTADFDNYLGRLGVDDIEEIICELPKEFLDAWKAGEEEFGGGSLVRDGAGNFYTYFKWSDTITCYDASLQQTDTYQVPKYVYGILQQEPGSDVYWYGCGMDNKPVVGNLTKGEILLESVEGIATDYQAEISTEGVLFLADTQNVWRVENGELLKVFPFTKNGYLISELYGMEAGKDGEITFLTKIDGDLTLLHMRETEKPQEKQEITMAFAVQHLGLNKTVARFNRQSSQYHVSVLLPQEGESEQDFRSRIQMELSAGRGPDILGYDLVENLPAFVENGFVECMDDVFEDTDLYLEAALEASGIEGKLYGVPYECNFEVTAYAKEDAGERMSWKLPELMEAVEASDAEILQKGYSGMSIVKDYALYDSSNTTYIDWQNGESHLNEQPFMELLAFAKEYADDGKTEKKAFAESLQRNFTQLRDMKELFACFEGDAAVLGYPRAEGNGIYVNTKELYLNTNSEKKEGAKAFLRYLISEKEQQKFITYDSTQQMREEGITVLTGHIVQFPVSLKAYDSLVELELEKDKNNVIYTDTGTIQIDALYTDEMIEQFYFMLEHARAKDDNVEAIIDMIYEELTPYFEGKLTAEEAAQKLDNRVQLYLDERVK